MTKVEHSPYKVRVILEETRSLLKPPLLYKIGYVERASFFISKLTFRYLVLKGLFRAYSIILILLVVFMFILAVTSQLMGNINLVATNYSYMFLVLLLLPFITYFIDAYQAMQLRLGMNLAVRASSYPKLIRGQERQSNTGKFEWTPTNLSILNEIIRDEGKKHSHGEFGKIANLDRQSAAGAIRKMISAGIVYEKNGAHYFSGIDFEVFIRKGKRIEPRQLTIEETDRLKYLFEVMCFVAF